MEGKSYTIHQGKQSQTTASPLAYEKLRRNLDGISYRMETVGVVDGIEFINDTKAVDLLSTRDSFKCLEKPTVWLTTTTPFDRDFALIESLIEESIEAIVVYGIETADMRIKLEDFVEEFTCVIDLREAVKKCFELAKPDRAVIYSPSCVVDDGYLNFVERSRAFQKYITDLEL